MSTPPEHTAGEPEPEPAQPAATSGDAPPSDPAGTAGVQPRVRVRDLTRWGIPFHYVPPVLVAAIGVVMLVIGGTVGTFGGWWLVAALPITIGGLLASPWFALLPAAVWVGWLIFASSAPDDADLSNTPTLVGLMLAAIGAGATVLAQHAVFPATERGAWEASIGRLVPPLDDGEPVELEAHTDEHTVDFSVVEPIEATDEEIKAAEVAAKDGATIAELPVVSERRAKAGKNAEAPEKDVEANEAAPEAEDTAEAEDSGDADADEQPSSEESCDEDATPPEAKVDLTKSKDKPEPVPATDRDIRIDLRRITELPLDADPAPLDEGGHVTEFAAISEADLTGVAEASETDSDAKPDTTAEATAATTAETSGEGESEAAGDASTSDADDGKADDDAGDAPLPAATQAGKRKAHGRS